jgi:hypothetical protein
VAARIYIHCKTTIHSKFTQTTCPVPCHGYAGEVVKASSSSCTCAPDLLYKPILIAYPYLNRPTRVSVLSGYTDSVVNKVLILPLRQVYQGLEPSKGVRSLELSVAAIVYYAPQPLPSCFALPVTLLRRQADRVL